jgi:L-fucose mutarotase
VHGDDLVITATNFPLDSMARDMVMGRLLRTDNMSAAGTAKAVVQREIDAAEG